jgi:hypothetical protein
MSVSAVSCHPLEVFTRFDVKNEVASDLYESDQSIQISIKHLKHNPDVPHLQLDGVHPKHVAILSINVHL